MKGLKLLFGVIVIAALAGCSGGGGKDKGGGGKSGGGGANLDTCIKEATSLYTRKSMPADQIKTAAEAACAPCKADAKACQPTIDALKQAP